MWGEERIRRSHTSEAAGRSYGEAREKLALCTHSMPQDGLAAGKMLGLLENESGDNIR